MNAREIRQAELEGEIENATTALQNQLTEYKEKGGNAVLILGIITSAYLLFRLITDSDEKEKTPSKKVQATPRNQNFITNSLIGLASTVAVGFAKNQILNFLDQLMNETKTK